MDEQLRRAAAPTLFIHYEDLVDRHNFRNATERIAGFLGYVFLLVTFKGLELGFPKDTGAPAAREPGRAAA